MFFKHLADARGTAAEAALFIAAPHLHHGIESLKPQYRHFHILSIKTTLFVDTDINKTERFGRVLLTTFIGFDVKKLAD